MEETKRSPVFRVMIVVAFLLMVTINAFAMLLPINGQTTAEVSDAYSNLFAPAGITFSIWSVIYILLAAYVVYQLVFFSKNRDSDTYGTMVKVGMVFILSSLVNAAWIFTWHYELFPASVILIAVLLLCLILISLFLRKKKLTFVEKVFVRLPFSIYFGWITVATIANITTLLVSIGWSGSGLSEATWTIAMIIVGTLIAFATVLFAGDPFYGLTVIWAFLGIVLKHLEPAGFDGQYMPIVFVTCGCIAILLLEVLLIAVFGKLPTSAKKKDLPPEESIATSSDTDTGNPPPEA